MTDENIIKKYSILPGQWAGAWLVVALHLVVDIKHGYVVAKGNIGKSKASILFP